MVNISPSTQIVLGIIGILVVIPGITYLVVEKSNEYTDKNSNKTYGNASFPSSTTINDDAFSAFVRADDYSVGGKKSKKHKKNKSRTLRR
jgi:hypothetical protein